MVEGIIWQDRAIREILSIGECMIELRREDDGSIRQAYSGDTLNTAVYLARLLADKGYDIFYLTALGDDHFSREMLDSWNNEGINTDLVQTVTNRLPGLYYIDTDLTGERSFYYWRNNSAARGLFSERQTTGLMGRLNDVGLLYLSGITLAILTRARRERLLQLLSYLHANGTVIVFDSNYRAQLWNSVSTAAHWFNKLYPAVDVCLVSFDNEQSVFADATPEKTCARLLTEGIKEVVVKNGIEPCVVSVNGSITKIPLQQSTGAIDTTAAGDSFNAAYLAMRIQGKDIRSAVSAGQKLAGAVVQHKGALLSRETTPTLQNLE